MDIVLGDQGREVPDKGKAKCDHSSEELLQKGGKTTPFMILGALHQKRCFSQVFKHCREMEDHSVHLTYHCMWDHSMHLINQVHAKER